MTELFFLLSGLLFGMGFLGGFYFYCIPFGVICLIFGWMNRPRQYINSPTIQMAPLTDLPDKTEMKFIQETDAEKDRGEVIDKIQKKKFKLEVENEVDLNLYKSANLLRKLLRCQTVLILFPGNREKTLQLKIFDSELSSIIPGTVFEESQGIVGRLLKPDVDRVLENGLSTNSKLHYYSEHAEVRALAAVPIIVNQKPNGAVVVDSAEEDAFDEEVINLLHQFAHIIGSLCYRTYMDFEHLYQKEQFKALFEYQKKFLDKMSLDDIYSNILSYAKTTLPFDRITIFAINDDDPTKGRIEICEGIDSDYFLNQQVSIDGRGLLTLAIMRNMPITRQGSSPSYLLFPEEKTHKGFNCLAVVPVMASGDIPQLAICVESEKMFKYGPHHMDLLKNIANVTGFAFARAQAYQEKEALASRDGLTGMYNHRTYMEMLDKEVLRTKRLGTTMGVLMTDIDKFKSVNDTYGHPIGDVVLRETSKIIQREIRAGVDTVARYGGEEFGVMIVDADENIVRETAERIRKAIESKDFEIGRSEPLKVTISLGYAMYPSQSTEIKEVLDMADKALYKAKTGGRNQVVGFH